MADKLYFNAANIVVFHCPACGSAHRVRVDPTTGKGGAGILAWNLSMDKPTFYPTLMVYSVHRTHRCHSIIRGGMITFLADCSHALAGQIIEIPDWVSAAGGE